MHEPIAYTYEADWHCPECTEKRFGRSEAGFIAEDSEDNECNLVGVVAPWDEWWQLDGECQVLYCGDCLTQIEWVHMDTHTENCPEYEVSNAD